MISPGNGPHQHGFTLVEMLVVLVILGLMGIIIVGHGPSHPARLELRQAVRQLAFAIRETHAKALYADQIEKLVVVPGQNIYGIKGETPHSLPGVTIEPITPSTFVFYPDGSVTGPELGLSRGKSHLQLRVNRLTGALETLNR